MLYLCFLVVVWTRSIVGWSSEGHQIISQVALEFLSSTGVRFWNSHLGGSVEDMVAASVWADSEEAQRNYPESPEYHFSHTPYQRCQAFDFKRDCGFNRSGNCLVSGIAGFLEYIVDPEIPRHLRVDALRFIIHFLGDIHQPLHTGFARDAGGVNIPLTDPRMTLHDLWDYELINRLKITLTKNPAGTWQDVANYIKANLSKDPVLVNNINAPVDNIEYFLDTDEARLEYASILATESSTESTCKYAYKDVSGSFIGVNATISDAYIVDRSRIVIRQLSRAGIRLAHLLNIVAELYYERKEDLRIEAQERESESRRLISLSPTSVPKIKFSNSFGALALDMDFEPDDLCEETDETASSAAASDCASSAAPTVCSSSRGKKAVTKSRKVVPVKTTTTVSPAMEDETSLTSSPTPSGWVDLSDLKLIKRKGYYYVTSVVLGKGDYEPMLFDAFRVRFTKNVCSEPITLNFDSAVFGRKQISTKMAIRAILQLKGISVRDEDIEEESTSSLAGDESALVVSSSDITSVERAGYAMPDLAGSSYDSSGYMGLTALWGGTHDERSRRRANLHQLILKRRTFRMKAAHQDRFRAQSALVGPGAEYESLEKKWDFEFFSKLNKIAVYLVGHIQAFIHIDTLSNSTNQHLRFSEHNGVFKGQSFLMLIDTAIYDGDLTPRIKKGLGIVQSKNMPLSDEYMRVRPTLISELRDIDMLFFDKDPHRVFRLKYVDNFFAYPGDDDESYHVFEWDLDTARSSLFV